MADDDIDERIEASEEAGDVPALLSVIGTCSKNGGDEDWSEAAESSLDAYYRLVKGGAAADGAMGAIFASLKAWGEEEAIVEVALGCVVASLSKSKAALAAGDDTNLDVSLILAAMRSFEDEATIQEQACLAIEALAASSDALKEKIKALDGIREELVAAKESRITNERNKAYPGRAAVALGIEL